MEISPGNQYHSIQWSFCGEEQETVNEDYYCWPCGTPGEVMGFYHKIQPLILKGSSGYGAKTVVLNMRQRTTTEIAHFKLCCTGVH